MGDLTPGQLKRIELMLRKNYLTRAKRGESSGADALQTYYSARVWTQEEIDRLNGGTSEPECAK